MNCTVRRLLKSAINVKKPDKGPVIIYGGGGEKEEGGSQVFLICQRGGGGGDDLQVDYAAGYHNKCKIQTKLVH